MNELSIADFTVAAIRSRCLSFRRGSQATEINDPEAMTLATVDGDGLPDARMVLCKGADKRELVFYTNIGSAKGRELEGQPRAAALFHWNRCAVRLGSVGVRGVTAAESDAYFASRPRESQIGAWASRSRGRSPRGPISKRRWNLRTSVRKRRRAPAGLLARLSARAGRDRVLARSPVKIA